MWGADLPRAFKDAGMRLGDDVLLGQLGSATVSLGKAEIGADGQAMGERAQTVGGNSWVAVNLQSLGLPDAERLKGLALAAQGASVRSTEQSASHGVQRPQGGLGGPRNA